MKFADVKNDIAFRKIFGNQNRTETLISFLNSILGFQGEERIESVTILDPYQLPKLKGGNHCETLTDKWIFFIKNAENLSVIPSNIEDKGLLSAYEEANQHTWEQAELDAYDSTQTCAWNKNGHKWKPPRQGEKWKEK